MWWLFKHIKVLDELWDSAVDTFNQNKKSNKKSKKEEMLSYPWLIGPSRYPYNYGYPHNYERGETEADMWWEKRIMWMKYIEF